MTVRSCHWVLAGAVLLGTCPTLTAQPATRSDEYLARMERVERFERYANERQPAEKVMDAVGVKPGMVIGEVGAGRGRYTVLLADRVGDTGKVHANDIDAEALAFLRERCQRNEISNIETVLGDVEDPHFPEASLDMVFMVWVYHMVESRVPLLRSFGPSLKAGATVVMMEPPPEEIEQEVEEAGGASETHITVLTKAVVERDAAEAGFELVRTLDDLLEKDIIYILKKR